MARQRKGEIGCEEANQKWRRTMLERYGGEEGMRKKMQEIGRKGGANGRGPDYKGGFASNRALARLAGAKGGRISRRTGIKNGEGKAHNQDIEKIEEILTEELKGESGRD